MQTIVALSEIISANSKKANQPNNKKRGVVKIYNPLLFS